MNENTVRFVKKIFPNNNKNNKKIKKENEKKKNRSSCITLNSLPATRRFCLKESNRRKSTRKEKMEDHGKKGKREGEIFKQNSSISFSESDINEE